MGCYIAMVLNFKGCDRVFKAKKGSSTDYHQEMNADNFEKRFQEKLISALPTNTLIVMDNASYHRYQKCLGPTILFTM